MQRVTDQQLAALHFNLRNKWTGKYIKIQQQQKLIKLLNNRPHKYFYIQFIAFIGEFVNLLTIHCNLFDYYLNPNWTIVICVQCALLSLFFTVLFCLLFIVYKIVLPHTKCCALAAVAVVNALSCVFIWWCQQFV